MTDAIPGEPPVAGVVKTSAVEPASSTMTDSGNVAVAARDHAHAQQNDVVTEPQATTTTTTATTTTTTASIPNILPLGGDVHPDHQAEVLKDAPDHLVEAQIEKTAEAAREHHGLPEQGTIIPGFEDSKLWAMRRRFDAQVLHVLSPPTKLPPGQPDLRPSTLPDLPFNSDLIKTNTERVYATAGIWAIYSSREATRLMSWAPENRRRTGTWCAGYFITWWFGLTLPVCCLICIIMIMHSPSRKWFFPPVPPPPGVPPSATDPLNRKGDESAIAGVGHPVEHRSKAEQIEQQAWEFTNTVQRFGARVVVGGHHSGHKGNGQVGRKQAGSSSSSSSDSSSEDEVDPRRIDTAQNVLVEKADGSKHELSARQKRKLKAKEAKKQRDAKVGQIAKTTQDILGDFADALERFANALSPPRPYPRNQARAKLAGAIFAPIMLVTAVVPVRFWANLVSFCFGVAVFGQPLLIRAAKKFVELVPDWQEKLDLRNSIFSGVPTNAQLILHILRVREMAHDPLPPPPPPPVPDHVKEEVSKTGIDGDDDDDHSAEVEIDENGDPVVKEGEDEGGEGGGVAHTVVKTGKRTVLGGLKLAAKKAATFKADVKVEGKKEKVGSKVDRFLYQSRAKDDNTPERYPAKLHGSSGHLVLTTGLNVPSKMQFVPLKSALTKPTFEVDVADLVEIKKRGVFIGRAVLGWAANISIEGMGLEMRFKPHEQRALDSLGSGVKPHEEDHEGDVHVFSHVGRRDQLFARLLSINQDQKWEML